MGPDRFADEMQQTRDALARVKDELTSLMYQVQEANGHQATPNVQTLPTERGPLRSARASGALHHSNMRTRYDLRRTRRGDLPRARERSV